MRTSRNDSLVRTLGLVGTTARRQPYTVGSFWAGPASILDVFKPETRAWLWAQYSHLHDQGAAGWWSDLGEPENHPEAMRHVAGPTRAVHNAYGQAWASIFSERYAQEYPEERLFNLARSGWAGLQRHSVFPWSGDINRSWSGYQAQVPVMLGMGQGGVGYMHSDAGGFCVGPIDSELYTRWLQMASLCPILRPHGEEATTIAELGIGTNEKAQLTGNIIEDEKLLGTAHVAFGASQAMGGRVQVPVHLDCLVMKPTVTVDGTEIVRDGELLIP